jgi:integrative and conjugative element protein (TIGR02256 family)
MDDVGAVFHRPDKSLMKVGSAPLQEMLRYRQVSETQSEAGGVLLGRLIECTWDVVVDEVTAPSRRDRRWRLGFFRSRGRAQRRIREAWVESQQTRNYLGEWHTHPEDHPVPSDVDLADWARIVAESRFEQDSLIFIIVGRKSVGAWELQKGGNVPIRLIPGPGLDAEAHEE